MSDSFVTPWTVAHYALLSMGFFLSKNTRVGCCFLLQGIFLTQGSSQPRDQTCVSCIAGRFFTAEPPHGATLDTRAKEICTQLLMLFLTCIKGISNFCLLIVFSTFWELLSSHDVLSCWESQQGTLPSPDRRQLTNPFLILHLGIWILSGMERWKVELTRCVSSA